MTRPTRPPRAARIHRYAALAAAALMAGSLIQAPPAVALPAGAGRPGSTDTEKPVAGRAQGVESRRGSGLPTGPRRPAHDGLPRAGSATVELDGPPAPPGTNAVLVGRPSSAPLPFSVAARGGGAVAALGLPVGLRRTPGAEATGSGTTGVRVHTAQQARAAGIDGLLLSLTGASGTTGRVDVTVDYSSFGETFGGGYGQRLRLVSLPGCALTTPKRPECRTGTRLPGGNDTERRTLSATGVPLKSAGAPMLLAAVAADTDTATVGGDYAATPLSSSAAWQTSLQTGDFSWSYPLAPPTVPGGLVPKLALAYASGSIDGQTSATNNQGSWVGAGFDMNTGFIERRYKACSEDGTWSKDDAPGDLCWGYDNATISFNGRAGELIPTGPDTWRIRNDDGTRVERLRDAAATGNRDDDGEYWKVTTTDGLQYFFGRNRLPGWASGKPETKSTWTVPVFGNNTGEPCNKATFATSWCRQAWRWNLDHVVDTNGNAMSYWYEPETNSYGRNRVAADDTPYERGGTLHHIEYGQRSDTLLTAKPAGRVDFANAERCLDTTAGACSPGEIEKNPNRWEDTPWYLNCASATTCDKGRFSPSFWTRKRLTKVTTHVLQPSGSYAGADSWELSHAWGDADIDRSLLLTSVRHTGLSGRTPIALPAVTFGYRQDANRLDRLGDGIAPFIKYRLSNISDESGGSLDVAYSAPDCSFAALPTPEANTTRCFPQYWQPPGAADPVREWFNKYVVTQVTATDRTGGSADMVTRYSYLDGGAWHWADDDGLTKEKYKTWSQWNGYGRVVVEAGGWDGMRAKSEHWFLRGMHGDRKGPGGGTKEVSVPDGEGATLVDHEAHQGFEYRTVTYDGPSGGVESRVVNTPWHKETAKRVRDWGTVTANMTGTEATRTWDRKRDGRFRETATRTEFDGYGRATAVTDLGEPAAGDEECTTTQYADNTTAWILALPKQVEVLDVACGTQVTYPAHVLSRKRNTYDKLAFGAAPTRGLVTRQEELTGWTGTTPRYRATDSAHDGFGRITSTTAPGGATTTTTYTAATTTTPGSVKITGPAAVAGNPATTQTVTTEYDAVRSLTTATVDANGKRSEVEYDALGRLSKAWLANRPKGASPTPSLEYTYRIAEGKISAIGAKKLANDGSQITSYILYDGWLRPRQSQSAGPDGGRLIDDTFYDERGLVQRVFAPYYALGAPEPTLFGVTAQGDIDTQTVHQYDGLGRNTMTRTLRGNGEGTELSRTTTSYSADVMTVDPPTGSTPTEMLIDAAGNTTELREFKGSGPTGAYDSTAYEYDRGGRLTKVTTPDKTVRSYGYDLLGRQTSSVDPDSGGTQTTYDDRDRVTTVTDSGRKKTIAFVYDGLGRHTETRENSSTGPLLASWTFDTLRKGYLTSSTRYVGGAGGAQYTRTVNAYDNLYRPLRTTLTIPSTEPGLGGTAYQVNTSYNLDGTLKSSSIPAAGSLPAEVVAPTYDALQRLVGVEGLSTYLTGATYTHTGKPLQLELSTGGKKTWVSNTYEAGTQRLASSRTDREGVAGVDRDAAYSYDTSGNVTSVTDTSRSGTDRQCFRYDHLQRLTEAWTPQDGCSADPGTAPLGGPARYWHSYTYTIGGNRDTETIHDPAGGGPGADTRRTHRYDENGKKQPNTLTSVVSTGAVTGTDTYTYDAGGNTGTRGRAGTPVQTLNWDTEGNLSSVTDSNGTSEYLYDADGMRLLRRQAGSTTLYLGAQEVTWTKATGRTTARRTYDLGGATAVRQDDGSVSFVVADHHGTGELAISADTQTLSQRRLLPFGGLRGSATGSWPTDRGFVGGTQDATGLTHLGAREYDPALGRFVSGDPVMDPKDPQQLSGYAYGHNNPLRRSDPSGTYDPDERDWCNKNPTKCEGGRYKPKPSKPPKKNPNPGMDKPRAHMPKVENERLKNIVEELYIRESVADKDVKGDGKTGTALIEEMNEGKAFGGKGERWHIEKAIAKLGGLRDLLEDDRKAKVKDGKGILSEADRKVAIDNAKELWTALNVDDVAGAVTKRVKDNPVMEKTMSNLIKTVIAAESMSEVTGQKFAVPPNLHPKATPRAVPSGEAVQGRGFAKSFGIVGSAAAAAHFPVDVYNYGLKEASKRAAEGITDPLDMIPEGQGAGCVFFGDCYVVVEVA
ncbi:RHS repeat domain-containing protein [Streptomyces erythrochromogenes]|uniref:RHS repeat domain-containing protein n=1 Tax=Streptomyces erythrochromogenes TaxID=285574 RepID=UPI0036CC4EE8